jgi:glycosyltransferase involved in cell wall biosynthesis
MSINTVSIITPAFNNLAGLIRLAGSLEKLSWPKEQLVWFICNDGSSDKTVAFFKERSYSFDVKVLSLETKSGPAKARNLGLEATKSDMILFLDSDVETNADLIERHVEMYDDPKIVAVRGEYHSNVFTKKSKWFRYLDSDLRGPRRDYAKSGKTRIHFAKVNTNNFSIRSSVLDLGLRFDENIVHYGGEDMVFAYQLSKLHKGAIVYQPNALTSHQHNSFWQAMAKLEEYGEKTIPYLIKNYPELYPHLVISRFYKKQNKNTLPIGVKLFFNKWGYYLARVVRVVSPDFISFRAIQYIMAWHVVVGYRKSKQNQN